MDATAKAILDQIKKKKFAPIYILGGDESYFIDVVSDSFEANALDDSEKSFNQVVVYGKDVTVQAILTHARRFPMMAEKQLVLVKEAQEIQDLNKEVGSKLLSHYIDHPVPSTILVLCHKHKPVDKRREVGKKADKAGFLYTFKKLYSNQLPDFVATYFRGKDVQADANAVQVLCDYVGNDLSRLTNEIDKLLIGKPQGTPVTGELVMGQVGISREYNVFELQKAVALRQTFKVFQVVKYFQANTKRNPTIVTVAVLYTFFCKLLAASGAKDKSERGLITELGINAYSAKDLAQALAYFNLIQIQNAISTLKTADLKLKGVDSGTGEDEPQILQELMVRILA